MLSIYNTLTNKKEEFIPINQGKVSMYVCGPTVYNLIHIGNARPLIVFDVVRRYFEYKGYDVNYVQNITDVDDKIINKANELGLKANDVSEKYTKEFFHDLERLGVKLASIYPKVTDNMNDIISFIEELINIGMAYEISGNVFYRTTNFKEYGKLSNQSINDLKVGARVDIDIQKENPMDFALWKRAKKDEIYWESPWGKGRPGWHTECSTLSRKYLGETIDIHGGGADLIFPHHENEIAQSECLSDIPLANYWMHNGHLTINNEKMSKSINNIITVRDLTDKYDADVLRFLLLSVHYRTPVNFSEELLENTVKSILRIKTTYKNMINSLNSVDIENNLEDEILIYVENSYKKFEEEMDDDFNTANVITLIFDLMKQSNIYMNNKLLSQKSIYSLNDLLKTMLEVLGLEKILYEDIIFDINEKWIEEQIKKRNSAKQNKDWILADQIRDELKDKGIILEDTIKGVRWRIK